jgi:hypothetical protein
VLLNVPKKLLMGGKAAIWLNQKKGKKVIGTPMN